MKLGKLLKLQGSNQTSAGAVYFYNVEDEGQKRPHRFEHVKGAWLIYHLATVIIFEVLSRLNVLLMLHLVQEDTKGLQIKMLHNTIFLVRVLENASSVSSVQMQSEDFVKDGLWR